MEIVKYYRVQGGGNSAGNSKSRNIIDISEKNGLILDNLRKVHIGSEEHNRTFLELRLCDKWERYANNIKNDGNVSVLVMYFPKFFSDLLRKYAIPEYMKTGDDTKAPPHTVDINKGEAYAIYGTWNEIMKNCCLYAKEVKVYNGMDTEEIYTDEEMPKFNLMDINRLKKFLIHAQKAGISHEEIESIIKEAEEVNFEIKENQREESNNKDINKIMTEEEFEKYIKSIEDEKEFRELDDFLKITQHPGSNIFEKTKKYLSVQHPISSRNVEDFFTPDYTHFYNFFEAYRKREKSIVRDNEGYIDLGKTLFLKQPLLYASKTGQYTNGYYMFSDGSIYIAKTPLYYYKGTSGVSDPNCKFNALIAEGIAKELGISTSENVLSKRENGQVRILSKYFLDPNEELVEFYDHNEGNGISGVYNELNSSLSLRNYSKNQIDSTCMEFLKQEFLAKLIGLQDQKCDNTGIIISMDESGNRSVRMAPMFDYDYSFKPAENVGYRVRFATNGKADIASFIEDFSDNKEFLEFVRNSIDNLDMEKVYERIYNSKGLEFFKNHKENLALRENFTEFVNANLQKARICLQKIEKQKMGEEK